MRDICKRVFDLFFVLFLIITLSPLYLFIFFMLSIEMILYRQFKPLVISEIRASKGKAFRLYKLNMYKENFRQEYQKTSIEFQKFGTWSYLQKNPNAITFFGKIMKAMYLDELGQFFNILKGDMSFVGPRPLPINYELNQEPYRQVLKAGLTSFAANKSKNEGDTIVSKSSDGEYYNIYKNSKGCEILKTDIMVIIDGFRAVLKAKGH